MKALRASRRPWLLMASLLLGIAAGPAAGNDSPSSPMDAPTHLNHGRFRDVLVYRPSGPATSFVLLLSGEEGFTATADTVARTLQQQGAIVTGVDWPKFKVDLEADADQCLSPDGDLENLSHFVQAYLHTPAYLAPLLVGIRSGAGMAYAMLAQAPSSTFAGALTLGFCPLFALEKPLCRGSGLVFSPAGRGRGVNLLPIKDLAVPWVNLHDGNARACPASAPHDFIAQIRGAAMLVLPNAGRDFASPPGWVPQFSAAFDKLAARTAARAAPPPSALSDLPIVEIPAQPITEPPGAAPSDAFAIIMSGDGGWAGLDQDVAAALSAKGIPVVGLDSLRYYWTARSPDKLAADADRMIRYYMGHFGKQRVLLIGYSQGADVLPFALNRLPAATRAHVVLAAVMGMSDHALFEFHLSSWISDDNSGPATLPEINRITGTPVLCIYGADEADSLCPKLDATRFTIVKLKGGHHFDGDYTGLARQILAAVHP
jgi:type IV secretory pathway VirJ component